MIRFVSRLILCIALPLALFGCDTIDAVGNIVDAAGWFDAPSKSDLKGERISVMTMDNSLRPDPELARTPVLLPQPYVNRDWPEPGGYATNAMYHLAAVGNLHRQWERDAGKGSDRDSRLTAPPVVAGGRVFVLDSEAHVFSFNALNGYPLWNRELAPNSGEESLTSELTFGLMGQNTTTDPSKGFGGGIAYDNGRIFVATGFGTVFALSASGGAIAWKKDLGVPIINAPVAVNGRVFVSSQDNHFVALDERDGHQLWDHQGIAESASILESTSVAVADQYVVVPYSSGELFALRTDNGRSAWNDMLTRSGTTTALSELDDIAGRPVIDRDMVFAISHSGIMVAININTGDRVWSRDIGGIQTPWAAGDFVYVLTTDSRLLCLARKDGAVKWLTQLDRWTDADRKKPIVWSGPVLISNRLILVSSDGYAISVSPYTGRMLKIPDGTTISPVVANGMLYFLTSDAQLVALR